jgi:hypothetical protein
MKITVRKGCMLVYSHAPRPLEGSIMFSHHLVQRALRSARLLFAPVAALTIGAVASPSALAANADLAVTVKPVPTEVSVSRADLPTYAAYEVTVTNRAGNVSNQALLTGFTGVGTFVETIPALACTAGATTDAATCNIGQLRGAGNPGSSATFTILFQAPTAGTQMVFDWTFTYSNGASPGAPPSGDITQFIGMASTTLTTANDPLKRSELKTYIPSSFDSNFFTGDKGTATTNDTSTTKLSIPATSGLTTAFVAEQVEIGGLTNDTLTKNTTTITIPSSNFFTAPITIELRRDASTIRAFNGIDRAPLFYDASADEPNPTLQNWPIPLCTQAAVQPAPNPTIPVCIEERRPLTKKNAAGQDIGDWLFILKALQNGVSRW